MFRIYGHLNIIFCNCSKALNYLINLKVPVKQDLPQLYKSYKIA